MRKYKKFNQNLKCKEISTLVLLVTFPNIVSIKYHRARKDAIIFFSLLSVPFFSEKGVI